MKVSLNSSQTPRKLMAAVGIEGDGYYLREGSGSRHHHEMGTTFYSVSLERMVAWGRQGVYEGDSITIQF